MPKMNYHPVKMTIFYSDAIVEKRGYGSRLYFERLCLSVVCSFARTSLKITSTLS
ncbi:hypothetical protein AN2V17_13140 [Vallitalea sp. AN17-2]|uniref:Uncharacterized protein n=1 Tax=Vallitalea maricola TaxID=3074433 RepID=A0ACB5UJJ1_9FIRM|nr:hypothetical protein AN2V17_13140 [Vallitalea sp. AN17-2]